MERVFVDANVIFSAAYNPARRIAQLWELADVQIITSPYAAAEAIRNLRRKYPDRIQAARRLLARTGLVSPRHGWHCGEFEDLPLKDRPILAAAIEGKSHYLLTGDDDFDHLFGRVIEGVLVLRPAGYLQLRERRDK